MVQQNKKGKSKESPEDKVHSQRKGSAFNEKPGGQPAHLGSTPEKKRDSPENSNEPPGLPEHNDKKGDKSVL